METYMYQIKNYVEVLIGFHINNGYGFESLQDSAIFLNLPHENTALINQIDKLTFARKFRGFSK